MFRCIQKYITPKTIIAGDLNFPDIDWNEFKAKTPISQDFLISLTTNNLKQLVSFPTRNDKILDLLLTNSTELISNTNSVPGLSSSDHSGIKFNLNVTQPHISTIRYFRDYSPTKFLILNPLIAKIDLSSQFTLQNKFDFLLSSTHSLINKHLPLKTIHLLKPNYPPQIQSKINLKLQYFRLLKFNPTENNKLKYKQICNEVRISITALNNQRLNKVITNSAKLYKYVKQNSHTPMTIPIIKHEGKFYTEAQEKADIFGSLFSESFTNVPKHDPPSFPCQSNKIISDIDFDVQTVSSILKYLPRKDSSSPDNIPYVILKNCQLSIAQNLTDIFRSSLDSGILPNQWKESIIIPLHKKGDKSDPKNYRPISLTSTTCRVIERIIAYHITTFLDKNKFFSKFQHGFLKNRSTLTQLISTFEQWYTALSTKQNVTVAYIDFKKVSIQFL